jgi:hypothetical protein
MSGIDKNGINRIFHEKSSGKNKIKAKYIAEKEYSNV